MKKFNTFGGRLFALLFVFSMIFSSSQAYAASNAWDQWQSVIAEEQATEENLLQSMKNTFSVELWHYSGCYWGNNFVRIDDTQVFDDADQLAEAVNAVMEFEMPLPEDIINVLNDGYNVDVVLSANGIPLNEIFMMHKGVTFQYANGSLIFKAYPKFNFDTTYKYNNFVGGLSKQIPFVAAPYGYNRYAMWTKNGKAVGAANGYFNPNDPYDLGTAGHIHPSQIINNKGHLQAGLDIYVDRENGTFDWISSNDIAIGYRTFANAGAVAVHFDYPVTLSFYRGGKVSNKPIDNPNENPGDSMNGNPNYGDGTGEPDIPTVEKPTDDTVSCGEVIRWTETDAHTKTVPCANHGSHTYTCTHYFTYEAALETSHTLSPAVLKSGYGFEMTADTAVKTKLVKHTGGCDKWDNGRNPEKTPQAPAKADVKLGYTVTNILGTQGDTVSLECSSNTGTKTAFITAQNPISVMGSRSIFTDIALSGTAENPAVHTIELYIYGGGVNGIEFCKSIRDSFTINGSMYDDDGTTS